MLYSVKNIALQSLQISYMFELRAKMLPFSTQKCRKALKLSVTRMSVED